MWDVHGGYTDALLAGSHEYLFLPADEQGRGGLERYHGQPPSGARVASAPELRDDPPDVVLLQRPLELDLCHSQLGRNPGVDLPAVFLEHNTPKTEIPATRHPLADAPGVRTVHVTHFNQLFWDCGSSETTVVEHGLADPGYCYTGESARAAFVVNEPVRRWRTTGTDLLTHFAGAPVDAFGIDADLLPGALNSADISFAGNLSPAELRDALALRRVYLHLNRWTSLGLSLIESMLLGMPVVVLDTTAASRTVSPEAGALSTDVAELARETHVLLSDRDEAERRGRVAREAALARHGLTRFLLDWDAELSTAAG